MPRLVRSTKAPAIFSVKPSLRICFAATLVSIGFGLFLGPGCANPDDTSAATTGGAEPDTDGTDGQVDVPTVDVPDVEDDTGADADQDVADVPMDTGPELPEFTEPDPPLTPLRRWSPALQDDLLVVTDHSGISGYKLGLPEIQLATFSQGTEATSPVIVDGLECWDINGDGEFDPTKEDFNGDQQGTPADCAFHPPEIPTGQVGAVVAVHPPGGDCELHAYTVAGKQSWVHYITGDCQQPARVGQVLLVPVTTGSEGTVRLVSVRDGSQGSQVILPGAPTTPPARINDGRFVIGYAGGIAILNVTGDPVSALFVSQSKPSLDTERATAVFPVGPQVVAAVYRRIGDPPTSLGRRIRQYDLEDNLAELPGTITTPSAMWGPPAAAFIDGGWSIAAGGSGWLGAFEADSGEQRFLIPAELGTVTGLAIGGDGRIYVSEVSWKGKETEAGGVAWSVWSINPSAPESKISILNEDEVKPVRWVGPPALLCDLLVAQVVPDDFTESQIEIDKPCSKALAPGGWARPYGNNGNTGLTAVDELCGQGPGATQCVSDTGCTINADCDDENKCTIDSCVSGFCSHKVIPGCCAIDEHCDDKNQCTKDQCVDGACVFTPAEVCCESSSECNDDLPCTTDVCESGFCEHIVDPKKPGCCTADAQCVDGDPCTADSCNFTQTCQNLPIDGCCLLDKDCNDFDACTSDVCVDEQCEYTPSPEDENCCEVDSDCNDGNPCTEDVCVNNNCAGIAIPECCNIDADCVDEYQCTVETCVLNQCEIEVIPTLPGCCETKAECKPPTLTACIVDWECNAYAECVVIEIDCDDDDDCTNDLCIDGQCVHEPLGCCTADADCVDDNPCTIGVCGTTGICGQIVVDGCCVEDDDCVDEDPGTTEACVNNVCEATWCGDFEFSVEPLPVDVVVVIDQSTSMTDEIPLIQQYMANFANFVTTEDVDFHVILVASRYQGENAVCVPEPLAGPNCTDAERFKQISEQVGSHDSLQLIIDNITSIESFMREGSSRHFLAFTDDFSELSATAFDFFLATRPGYDDYTFHAVTGYSTETCATGLGTQYQILADQTGGIDDDICSMTWTGSYQKLAEVTIGANVSFPVPYQPVDGTITVVHDMTPLTEDTQWVWDPELDRVYLLSPFPSDTLPATVCFEVQNFNP